MIKGRLWSELGIRQMWIWIIIYIGDYTLVSRKNIRKIGFKPFNYSEAGVYGDKEWRKKALLSLQKLELFKKMASIRLQK